MFCLLLEQAGTEHYWWGDTTDLLAKISAKWGKATEK
jgi:hypothetical protein